ncbi:oligosaccharide repeat unit polymerase [Sutcliffiella horikoshii]|uniref:O-antigen polymerase n=1 Tax=Sutcliffiella horikoshii TaxID=79883 RepID=UPI00384F2BE8
MTIYLIVFILVSSIFFMTIIFTKNKEINYLVLIFNLLWIIIALVSYPYLINKNIVYIQYIQSYILFFMISMNIGFLFFMPSSKNYKGNRTVVSDKINYGNFWFILIVVFILLSFFFRRVLTHVLNGDLTLIRRMIYTETVGTENSLFNSGIETIFIQWFANSLILALFIILISFYMIGLKNNKLLIFLFLIGIYYAFLTGGRMMLFRFAIIIIGAILLLKMKDIKYIVNDTYHRTIRNRKKKLRNIIVLIFFMGVVFTVMRSDNNFSITDNQIIIEMLNYFRLPIVYFTTLIENSNFNSGFLYGGGFVGGLFLPIELIWKNFSENIIDLPPRIIIDELEPFQYIGEGLIFNALPTMLYVFYRDGGVIGIIINSLIFSLYLSIAYRNYLSKKNIRSISLYILAFYVMVMGIIRWEPALIQYWLTLFFIILFTNSKFLKKGKTNIPS